ncbi:MAG: deoxyribonuclease IV [Terriglobia bacterium]
MTRGRVGPTANVRLGIHTSIAGGLELAADRAAELGCDAFQIFSASPRLWQLRTLNEVEAAAFRTRRNALGLTPLAIHDNYLINLAASHPVLRTRSIQALQAEVERAQALEADYLILHPGSAGPQNRNRALAQVADALRQALRGIKRNGLRILLENTAGQGTALGAELGELRALLQARPELNLGVCIDTAHLFAAGYDIRSEAALERTLEALHRAVGLERVRVIHLNDSRVSLGRRVDRHEHIGKGKIGLEAFRRLLHHPGLAGKTFILETPIDRPQDDRRNLRTLRRLAGRWEPRTRKR